jgi:hypothetical protein
MKNNFAGEASTNQELNYVDTASLEQEANSSELKINKQYTNLKKQVEKRKTQKQSGLRMPDADLSDLNLTEYLTESSLFTGAREDSFDDDIIKSLLEERDIDIEIGPALNTNSDIIHDVLIKEKGLNVSIDSSEDKLTYINSSDDYLKYQNKIMDNKCISIFWPFDDNKLIGSTITISTDNGNIFVLDTSKIDIHLLNVLTNAQRPVKVFYDAKPVIAWCIKNNLSLKYIFDVSCAFNILTNGKYPDNSIAHLLLRYSNFQVSDTFDSVESHVFSSKFLLCFRKSLIACFEKLGLMPLLNMEQRILFALAHTEINGLPYKQPVINPLNINYWELIESKYGVTTKKELVKAADIFSLSPDYLEQRSDLLEVLEFISFETSEKIIQHFNTDLVSNHRIHSQQQLGAAANIVAKSYSFNGRGSYPFISADKDNCLIQAKFIDLEMRALAKLINSADFTTSFLTKTGPYGYFAGPLFDKSASETTIEERFKAKILIESIIRDLNDKETFFYFCNNYSSYIKEDEVSHLKKKFKHVHHSLINHIQKTKSASRTNGYVSIQTGRYCFVKNEKDAFITKIDMLKNEILLRSLDLAFSELTEYNAEFSPHINLCTIYDRIITLECHKNASNISIDILTRSLTKACSKLLQGIPIAVKVYATPQWEA